MSEQGCHSRLSCLRKAGESGKGQGEGLFKNSRTEDGTLEGRAKKSAALTEGLLGRVETRVKKGVSEAEVSVIPSEVLAD